MRKILVSALGIVFALGASAATGFPPPTPCDVRFVVNSGAGIGSEVWTGGTISIPFPIKRYFGDVQKLVKNRIMPETVKMEMPQWDVDAAEGEVDEVYVNGHFVGYAHGSNGEVVLNQFTFDTTLLNFPTTPGETAQNTISVKVGTGEGDWVTRVDWVSVEVPAPPPIVLCHGIGSGPASFDIIERRLKFDLGFQYAVHSVMFYQNGNRHIDEFSELTMAVNGIKKNLCVDKVNILAHSMGGLRARGYARVCPDNVMKIVQIASPNGGSPLADFVCGWVEGVKDRLIQEMQEERGAVDQDELAAQLEQMSNAIANSMADYGFHLDPWRDPAIRCLQISEMARFNKRTPLSPSVDYSVVAGNVTSGWKYRGMKLIQAFLSDPAEEWINDFLHNHIGNVGESSREYSQEYLRAHLDNLWRSLATNSDMIVPVWSATGGPVPSLGVLSGTFEETWHSGLLQAGAPRVFDIILPKLRECRYPDDEAMGNGTRRSAPLLLSTLNPKLKSVQAENETNAESVNTCAGILKGASVVSIPLGISGENPAVVMFQQIPVVNSRHLAFALRNGTTGETYTDSDANIMLTNDNSSVWAMLLAPQTGDWFADFSLIDAAPTERTPWQMSVYEQNDAFSCPMELVSEDVQQGGMLRVVATPTLSGKTVLGTLRVCVTEPDGRLSIIEGTRTAQGYTCDIPANAIGSYRLSVTFEAKSPRIIRRTKQLVGNVSAASVVLAGEAAPHSIDTDGNGLYDLLDVRWGVDVSTSGTYRAIARLVDSTGALIAQGITTNFVLSAGTSVCSVPFPVPSLVSYGPVAEYRVENLQIYEVGEGYEAQVASCPDACRFTLDLDQYEHARFWLNGGHVYNVEDLDGDGVYDELEVNVNVACDTAVAGYYSWSGVLQDGEGAPLGVVSGYDHFSAAGTTLAMRFAGEDIRKTDLDGPYYVRNIIIYDSTATHRVLAEVGVCHNNTIEQWGGVGRYKGFVEFLDKEIEVDEGGVAKIRIRGGSELDSFGSVQVCFVPVDATLKDLALPKGALFPMTMSWADGDCELQTLSLPIATDALSEGDESFLLALTNPSGMLLGETVRCKVTIHEQTLPKSVSLAQALNAPNLKVASSGTGRGWSAATGSWGVRTLVAAPDSPGKTSVLKISGMSGRGKMVAVFNFTGEASESKSSIFTILAGKSLMRTYYKNSVATQLQRFTVNDHTTGAHTYTYTFERGTGADSGMEMRYAYWVPEGQDDPVWLYASVSDPDMGYVTGMGNYALGATVKIAARAYPGREFRGWYSWSDADGRYVLWDANPDVTLTVKNLMDLRAAFVRNPRITAYPDLADCGTVAGGGLVLNGKATLKAAPAKGSQFKGWFLVDSDGRETAVSDSPSYTISDPTLDATYVARFTGQPMVFTHCLPETGTVKGGGRYQPGKSVTLTAAPSKGYVFRGWFAGNGANVEDDPISQNLAYSFVMPATNIAFSARFVDLASDSSINYSLKSRYQTEPDGTFHLALNARSYSLPKLTVKGLPSGLIFDAKKNVISGKAKTPGLYVVTVSGTNASVKKATESTTASFELFVPNLRSGLYDGELDYGCDAYRLTVGVDNSSLLPAFTVPNDAKIAVSGLPSGVKWDARLQRFVGFPTKDGNYTVTITTTVGGVKNVDTVILSIRALPVWAVGSFDGYCKLNDVYGTCTIAVSAVGKVSLSCILSDGQKLSTSVSSLSSCPTDTMVYLEAKDVTIGKTTANLALVLTEYSAPSIGQAVFVIELPDSELSGIGLQNVVKRKDVAMRLPKSGSTVVIPFIDTFKGIPNCLAQLTAKAGSNGVVKFTLSVNSNGVSLSDTASGQLLPTGEVYIVMLKAEKTYHLQFTVDSSGGLALK